MPYIKQVDRNRYDSIVDELSKKLFEAADGGDSTTCFPGHLNYIITSLIKKTYEGYLQKENSKLCYSDYNAIIGMLESCKLEYYRKSVAKFEKKKIKENGDV